MAIRNAIAVTLALIAVTTSADAAIMHVHDSTGNLGTVNTETGAVSNIGNMGHTMTDIAFDPNGNLFGLTFTQLFSINATTASATLIGNHGIAGGNALVFGANGTLYGAGTNNLNLYTINTGSGSGTSLGNMGFASGGDLAFVGNDLYLASQANQLVKVDLTNLANTSAVGLFGVPSVFGIATSDAGVLHGVAGTNIYTINLLTGAATNPVSFAGGGLGQAFGQSFYSESGAPPPIIPLPAPIFLLLGSLGLLGAVGRRNRA